MVVAEISKKKVKITYERGGLLYFKYTNIGINIISFVITSIVLLLGDYFIFNVSKVKINFDYENKINYISDDLINNETVILNNVITIDATKDKVNYPDNWKLKIPKINLEAKIVDGTTDEILNKYIGHFTETEVLNGNIALAAHNRGYDVNYFKDLKSLEIDDIVYYDYGDIKREYKVYSKEIIKDTNIEVLENLDNNKNILTLITCVENMPELRRCIRCIEINSN